MKLSRLHWAIISVVTVALVVTAPSDKVDIAKPAKQSLSRSTTLSGIASNQRTAEVGRVELERLTKNGLQQADKKIVSNVFDVTSWYVPPPAPRVVAKPTVVIPPPPPVPVAPLLPFTYLGRYEDTASRTIILSKGERVYTVAVGDVIENTYRVEKFTPGLVHLTYLPLSVEQTLRTGESL